MVVTGTKQKWFINSDILETLKDSPKTPSNVDFLEQRGVC